MNFKVFINLLVSLDKIILHSFFWDATILTKVFQVLNYSFKFTGFLYELQRWVLRHERGFKGVLFFQTFKALWYIFTENPPNLADNKLFSSLMILLSWVYHLAVFLVPPHPQSHKSLMLLQLSLQGSYCRFTWWSWLWWIWCSSFF